MIMHIWTSFAFISNESFVLSRMINYVGKPEKKTVDAKL